ncbi:pentapeptide repeat-containing protein [Dyadobacter sp. LJ53]|uniref:pentapeptide repeat-containing protein n=1 Tax=Dyadobacter chenwenxiniae TaxID=2906456 RepID=UPI001F22DE2B|nr:pentapeptide repeat-containing protein [Dyadobacter chenwenxiniae]MCF0050493.1 pentapeptide repeat-containing protein [Dyadobacter chenwenxiniae]
MNSFIDPSIEHRNRFEDVFIAEEDLDHRVWINCEFVRCNFRGSDLSGNNFIECTFTDCDFSETRITDAGFRDAVFSNCKMNDVDFSVCNTFIFSFSFNECVLDHANFFNGNLTKTTFKNCSLLHTNFEEADLSEAIFDHCDLDGARFVDSILEKTDFRTAHNFNIDPTLNRLKRSKFSGTNLTGLLRRYKLDIESN